MAASAGTETVSGAGTYAHGSMATLVATADVGYSLPAGRRWSRVGRDRSRNDRSENCHFFHLNQYELVASAGTGGTVSGAGTYEHGSMATLVATADVGYSFAGWTIDGEEAAEVQRSS